MSPTPESNFVQYLMKEYLKSLTKSFQIVMDRMETDEGCLPCQDQLKQQEEINFVKKSSKKES